MGSIEYMTLERLSWAIQEEEDLVYEDLVSIVKDDKYFKGATTQEIDEFLTPLLSKLNKNLKR